MAGPNSSAEKIRKNSTPIPAGEGAHDLSARQPDRHRSAGRQIDRNGQAGARYRRGYDAVLMAIAKLENALSGGFRQAMDGGWDMSSLLVRVERTMAALLPAPGYFGHAGRGGLPQSAFSG